MNYKREFHINPTLIEARRSTRPLTLMARIPGQLGVQGEERQVWYGRQSYVSYVGSIIFGFVLLVLGFLVTASLSIPPGISRLWFFGFFILFALVDWALVALNVGSSEYSVSNKRVFIRRGILGRASHDLQIEWMTGTVVSQNLFGRMLNFGDIMFTGAGTSGNVTMNGVFDVQNLKGVVEDVIQDSKEKASMAASHSSSDRAQPPPNPSRGNKFCQFCGSKMPSPAAFCPSCGKVQL